MKKKSKAQDWNDFGDLSAKITKKRKTKQKVFEKKIKKPMNFYADKPLAPHNTNEYLISQYQSIMHDPYELLGELLGLATISKASD